MYTDTTPAITSRVEALEGLAVVREQCRLLDGGLVVLAAASAMQRPGPVAASPAPTPERPAYDSRGVFAELALHGCVSFDDGAVTEFAIAAGLTEYSARKLIREAIMLV